MDNADNRIRRAEEDVEYWYGRYEALCGEIDTLTSERDAAIESHRNAWGASGELEESLARWKARAVKGESDASNWKRNILTIEAERERAIRILDRSADANLEAGRRIWAVRDLHHPDGGECPTCSDDRGPLRSPCPTLRALDGDA